MPEFNAAWRTRNIGALLFAATGHVVREKLRVLHRAGFGAISEAQLALFHNLDAGGTRLTALAARAGLTKQGMIELVDKGEALGFVTRHPDPDDRRAKIVRLSPRGGAVMAALGEGVLAAERRVAASVGAGFVREAKRALGVYAAIADERNANIGRVFALSARRFVADVLATVHEEGYREVGEVLLALFRNLDLDGTRLTDIAQRARITKQSMRELVDRAEALGFVAREPDPADRRAKTIRFTPAGRAMLAEMQRGIVAAEARFAAITGDDFVATLKERLAVYNAGEDRLLVVATAA